MSRNILPVANNYFRDGSYVSALEMYCKAAEIYPGMEESLQYNIQLCRKKVNEINIDRNSEDITLHDSTTFSVESKVAFDADWYLRVYADVASTGLTAEEHYKKFGQLEGRFMSYAHVVTSLFDYQWYAKRYPELVDSGIDLLTHYIKYGHSEGRLSGRLEAALFDEELYLIKNPDVSDAKVNALEHYFDSGKAVGRTATTVKSLTSISPEKRVYSEPVVNPGLKILAFYLPQFHPIPENDLWWGDGFTEWTNVARGRPMYEGHYQPRLPGALSFYDLTNPEVLRKQAEIARNHGVTGFCFYLYWFGGERLLEKPISLFLENKDIDIEFCFCWANENWTRRWDGLDNEVLISQRHSPTDDIDFIAEVSTAFSDKRYVKINGKPLLVIYRPNLFPEFLATVQRWRDWCRRSGVGEIYICYSESFESINPSVYGLDASIEFPPANIKLQEVTEIVPGKAANFSGQVHSYIYAMKQSLSSSSSDWVRFRGVMPSWDNTARKMEKSISFYGANPELYSRWLDASVSKTLQEREGDERLVFINAWNEWGEGAVLEPDRLYGYAYLNRTREVIEKYSLPQMNVSDLHSLTFRRNDVAVIIHLYHFDLFGELADHLDVIADCSDLYFSVRSGSFSHSRSEILKKYPNATVVSYPNHARDVLPFLKIYGIIKDLGYSAICKIHSKKSTHRSDGAIWRSDIMDKLLGSRSNVFRILELLKGDIGVVAPHGHLIDGRQFWGSNSKRVTELAFKFGATSLVVNNFLFPAGTMFWFKPASLVPLMSLGLVDSDFEVEAGQVDGTTAHAVERLIGISCATSGLKIIDTNGLNAFVSPSYNFAKSTDISST